MLYRNTTVFISLPELPTGVLVACATDEVDSPETLVVTISRGEVRGETIDGSLRVNFPDICLIRGV